MILRDYIRMLIKETISASPSYMLKEEIREKFQETIVDRINNGKIKNDSDLSSFFKDAEMALNTLKAVPFKIWNKIPKE